MEQVGAIPLKLSRAVLIPLNSGLAWSCYLGHWCHHRWVLIPLNSGLAWSRVPHRNQGGVRLNPFEFRAGLEQMPAVEVNLSTSLNPFEFRAGLEPSNGKNMSRLMSLNPFEFRAGLEPPLLYEEELK